MGWREVTKETRVMEKYMEKRNIGKWTSWSQKDLKNYVFARINKILSENNKVKPYVIYNKRSLIERCFHCQAGPISLKYKSVIRLTVNAIARTYYRKNKVERAHARTVPIWKINEIAEELSKGNSKELQTALALWITHYTAARMAEALTLQWDDFEDTQTSCGKFWVFTLRSTKTNVIPLKKEQLTIKREPSKRVFIKVFKRYYRDQGKPSNGYVFDQAWATTHNVNYQLEKISKIKKITPKLTAHSGRNFALQQLILGGVDESTIKQFMRWNDNSQMLQSYRNTTLECTSRGAAHLLKDFNFV